MTMMYGAGIADSNSHDPYDIPIVLAGGGAGLLKGGRHIRMRDVPLANLHLTLLDHFGIVMDKFGDSNGRVDAKILSLMKAARTLSWSLVAQAALGAAGADARLIKAVRSKDAAAVRALIKQRVDVNAPQGDGATALHWAAHVDDLAIADLLIRAGARAAVANDNGFTPLHLACTNRNGAMVERLLSAGADANAASLNGETVLMTCARSGDAAGGEGAAREGRTRQREGKGARARRRSCGRPRSAIPTSPSC